MNWKKELFCFLEMFNKVTLYLDFYHSIEMADNCFGDAYCALCTASNNYTPPKQRDPHYEILREVYKLAKEANEEKDDTKRAEKYYRIVNYILDSEVYP